MLILLDLWTYALIALSLLFVLFAQQWGLSVWCWLVACAVAALRDQIAANRECERGAGSSIRDLLDERFLYRGHLA